MGCTRLRGEWLAERHSDRESVIALCLKEHLAQPNVKILVDHPSREIVYCVDAGAGRPSFRPLQLSFAMIADHGMEQLEEILDSHRRATSPHTSLSTPDQRQGRTLHPDPAPRMGLSTPLPNL